ncbi:MAG: hypothetical protein FJ121_00820 [Deltaproteobacteria bacterium]|nr:hypothetical protein [Deltaproteobacteria bacterium]
MNRTDSGIMIAALLVGGGAGMSTTQPRPLSRGALIGWAAGCPAGWEGMLTAGMRNRRAGHEGISLILRVTSC